MGDHRDAVILLLGYTTEKSGENRCPSHAIGLIHIPYKTAKKQTPEKWKMMGVCTWSLRWSNYQNVILEETKGFMMGVGKRWINRRGVFD